MPFRFHSRYPVHRSLLLLSLNLQLYPDQMRVSSQNPGPLIPQTNFNWLSVPLLAGKKVSEFNYSSPPPPSAQTVIHGIHTRPVDCCPRSAVECLYSRLAALDFRIPSSPAWLVFILCIYISFCLYHPPLPRTVSFGPLSWCWVEAASGGRWWWWWF